MGVGHLYVYGYAGRSESGGRVGDDEHYSWGGGSAQTILRRLFVLGNVAEWTDDGDGLFHHFAGKRLGGIDKVNEILLGEAGWNE